ncbi:hypothetical protein BHE74_00005849 [Ensete ventricosum]|nr:hypothetical protein GW17_00021163 [Ensete ventricosum]RWW85461.1 hypothetical protein BHE74_00005849 [Ensete ventricosum]
MWLLVCCSVLFSRDVAFGLDKREIRSEGEEKCEEGGNSLSLNHLNQHHMYASLFKASVYGGSNDIWFWCVQKRAAGLKAMESLDSDSE